MPIATSFERIERFSVASESVMKLDYLIGYFQSGLSFQVEAILRGHDYLKTFPIDSALFFYDSLKLIHRKNLIKQI